MWGSEQLPEPFACPFALNCTLEALGDAFKYLQSIDDLSCAFVQREGKCSNNSRALLPNCMPCQARLAIHSREYFPYIYLWLSAALEARERATRWLHARVPNLATVMLCAPAFHPGDLRTEHSGVSKSGTSSQG